ncbi:MarR family winged helix-turn-helix transcriptional regulator [Pseudoprimorskyibacter insulae]|uniref:Transcriptional regulator SlyA n=1 Tax=Pseudoprimorskyibacter insulae TaxID=1695997 RepID=A0A2R8APP4_9RHOB|nr:MarR family transcriptional regulator [Pseudoprimorskyibacter insulae]SPF78046.1 Transcriptional regulator SlyA [Pseudoprimorskyibacter insulae]
MAGSDKIAKLPGTPPGRISDETLRQFIGYYMKRAYNVIQSDLVNALKPYELRLVTYSALVIIHDNPGLRQSQLADVLAIERPNLVVIVDELEQRDLIVRDRSAVDRRAYALRVTKAGAALYDAATKAVQDHEDKFCAGMSPEQRATVLDAMNSIWNMKTEASS